MAEKAHIDMLQQGVTTWNAWRETHPEIKIDLSGADFSGARLNFINLSEADLSKADLSGAKLKLANLSGAYLVDANLSRTSLQGIDLSNAYLVETDLSEADLSEADLSGARLNLANLSRAVLIHANLSQTYLSRANFSRANLDKTDLSGADTYLTHFVDLDLRNVKGLEHIHHRGPSHISTSTFERSGGEIPEIFLKGVGVSDTLIAYTHSLFHQPIEYYTCFISFSSKDELFAKRLHNDLQQEGIRCWFAPEDMDIGDKIRHRIEESIRLYDKLLLILSEHSIASNWVAYEVERALNKEPQGQPNVLYPVRVDKTIMTCTETWVHDIKSTRHIGDFEHWTDPQQYEESFKRLLRALNTKKDQQKK